MPKEALDKANAELKKLKLMSPMSAEATVVRNYIDTLVSLPWKKKSKVNNDLTNAEKNAGNRSLWPREGQGTHSGISRGATARRQAEGAHPVLRGSSRRG